MFLLFPLQPGLTGHLLTSQLWWSVRGINWAWLCAMSEGGLDGLALTVLVVVVVEPSPDVAPFVVNVNILTIVI